MRLFYISAAAAAVLFLAGCVNVQYIGDVYPPTTHVRFFMNEKDVPAGTYFEMGRVTVSIDDDDAAFRSGDVLSDAIREKAKEVGADAVLIHSSTRYKVGTVYNSSTNTAYHQRRRGKNHTKYDRYRSRELQKQITSGVRSTYSAASQRDVRRDEVTAKFLKKK